jgi:predicted amidohydrolase YtcJ
MAADRTVVLVNARVWPAGDRLAVTGPVIGPEDADGERIDLGGARVVPGLVDAHVHFPSWALDLRELRLFGTRSLGEALERIEAAEKPSDGWLRGRGWREEEWPAAAGRRRARGGRLGRARRGARPARGHPRGGGVRRLGR